MSNKRRCNLGCVMLAALLSLLACGPESDEPVTQVIVAVNANAMVIARVVRLEARIVEPDGGASVVHRFALRGVKAPDDAKVTALPFSFGIVQQRAKVLRLELAGYDSWAAGAAPIIEHKLVIRFLQGRTSSLAVYLAGECLDRAAACADNALTCSAERGGDCVPVADATLTPTMPGRETYLDGVERLDAGPTSIMDAGPTSIMEADARMMESAAADAGVLDANVELPPELLPACPVEGACPIPAYPCVLSDDGLGYACRGQYAAWPMPDPQPDAKYAPSYTIDAKAGTVLDDVTGLLWQRDLPASYRGCTGRTDAVLGDSCTHEEAEHYCSQLTLAGKRWRLPAKVELESLLSTLPGKPNIDTDAFPEGNAVAPFWSSSRVLAPACTDCAYTQDFAGGVGYNAARSAARRVRCVHSARNPNAPPPARYSVDVDGTPQTVNDNFTGLTWIAGQSAGALSQEEASRFCARIGVKFRVPTIKELFTLTSLSRSENTSDPVFAYGGASQFSWSTSPARLGGTYLYSPGLGMALPNQLLDDSFSIHVQCVR